MFENRNIVVLKTNFVLFLSAGSVHHLTRGNQQDGLHQFHLTARGRTLWGAVLMSRRGKADQILGMSHPTFMG